MWGESITPSARILRAAVDISELADYYPAVELKSSIRDGPERRFPLLLKTSPANRRRLKHLLEEGFSAMDVAEPLASFDADSLAVSVRIYLKQENLSYVGVRENGFVCGFASLSDLGDGRLGDYLHPFTPGSIVSEEDSLRRVIQAMREGGPCFVKVLGEVGAVITLTGLENPRFGCSSSG